MSPIRGENGDVVGIFHPVTETTAGMLSERRIRAVRAISEGAEGVQSVSETCARIGRTLNDYSRDIPFCFILARGSDEALEVAGASGLPDNPQFTDPAAWSLEKITVGQKLVHIKGLTQRFGKVVCGEYPEPITDAFILPITYPGVEKALGFLIGGVSPRLPFDDDYHAFYEMIANAVNASVQNARAYEEEKKRAEALAELDRAKTAFFSNVSHEFRTPLTLMLGPGEDLLRGAYGEMAAPQKDQVEVIQRNAMRLLRLVNSLLDFARLESDRIEAHYSPVDLAKATSEVASNFQSAITRAGVKYLVDCPPLSATAYIDRDMWEKIVLNLISNAFKFTLSGEIRVALRESDSHFKLTVSDTGTGIPKEELPKIFNRFHRIAGAKGRTFEGTGIGLALVTELSKLHGGTVTVESEVGKGSTFTVTIPQGSAHLPADRVSATTLEALATSARREAFVGEALRWLPDADIQPESKSPVGSHTAHVLLADDNSDMRNYIKNLLSAHYRVTAVSNGEEALRAAKMERPDLIVSDVMMPIMDGAEFLKAVRQDPDLEAIPFMLLSARAGEEAKAGGIELGADDYLTKPFSARELLARVNTQLMMDKVRRSAAEREVTVGHLKGLIKARDEFLSIASHELKTPLTVLKLQLQVGLRRLKSGEEEVNAAKVAETFATCLRQVDSLARLVEDLLDVSRVRMGQLKVELEDINLSNLTNDVMMRFKPTLENAGCKIKMDIQQNIRGHFDRHRIEQVIVNLMANVIKYAPRSAVDVSLRLSGDGHSAELSVKDTGSGIAQAMHAKIFERFERAVDARNISGMGLGLFISKSIVEAHHGSIHVESAPGQGARFTVELPVAAPQ